MEHNYCIELESVTLRPLKHGDIEQLRIWRNEEENSKYIRKLPYITPEGQESWFREYINDPSAIAFAICKDSKLVGSVALYNLREESASFGQLMIGEEKGCGLGSRATIAVLKIAFEMLGLKEVVAEVSVDNTSAIVIYVRIGFCIVGRDYNSSAKMDEFKLKLEHNRFNSVLRQGLKEEHEC